MSKLTSLVLTTACLSAQGFALEYQGQNTFTLEHYNVDGNLQQGIYPHEGYQRHNDLNINFWDDYSPYANMRGYLQASSNHSAYRGEHGGRLNSASVHYENGEMAVPFRVDFGDFFASQSRRTVQRGLKGMQAEFQPLSSFAPQSVQVFWGRSAQNYDTFFDQEKDYYYGASWLADLPSLGSVSLTHVRYYDDALELSDGSIGGEEAVSSLAWYRSFSFARFTHEAELELAYLVGENRVNESLNGRGEFIKIRGFSRESSDYLISYERNNREFTPQGASITPDRESIDLQWGQKIVGMMKARLRGQRYRDQLSSENISTTKLVGLNVQGRPIDSWLLNLSMDVSFRDESNEEGTKDRDTLAASLSLSLPVNDGWRNRFSYQWQNQDDQTVSGTSIRRFYSLGSDFSQTFGPWDTTISPSLNYNEDRDGSRQPTSSTSVGLNLTASQSNHSLLLSHQERRFLTDNDSADDTDVGQSRFQWRYTRENHVITLNADRYDYSRVDDPDEDAISTKLSLAWTYKFAKPESSPLEINRNIATMTAFNSLYDIQLNRFYDESLDASLSGAGWQGIGSVGNLHLYVGELVFNLENRQVMVLEKSASAILSANVLFDFVSQVPAEQEKEYKRILDELLKRYGQPTRQRSTGDFASGWGIALSRSDFVRIAEWQFPSGVLRFGIPSAKQGNVRMEAQFKPVHSGLEDSDWGINIQP